MTLLVSETDVRALLADRGAIAAAAELVRDATVEQGREGALRSRIQVSSGIPPKGLVTPWPARVGERA